MLHLFGISLYLGLSLPLGRLQGGQGQMQYTLCARLGDHEAAHWIVLGLALIALVLIWPWYKAVKRKRLVEDVPTSKVKGVAIGLCEVKGAARRSDAFTSYLAGLQTVWYRYNVSEHWKKTVTETYTDSNGKRRTRRKTKSGWKTVQSDEISGLFFLEDESGAIQINPHKAKVEGRQVFSTYCTASDPLYYGKGPRYSVSHSTGRRHFTEHAIVLDDPLYVMGTARLRQDAVAAEIAYDQDDPLFLISTRSESQIRSGYGVKGLILAILGALFAMGSAGALASSMYQADIKDAPTLFAAALGGLGYGVILTLLYAVLLYNGLVRVRENIGKAWSLIEVQLKRRSDLIPQLAAVVKGYADYERETQEGVAQLRADRLAGRVQAPKRAQLKDAQRVADGQTRLLTRVLGVVEAYPQLKSNDLYLNLQRELSDTEDRIALARSFYNDTVTAYNERVGTLPDAIFASLMKIGRIGHYTIDAFERRPVDVSLIAGQGDGLTYTGPADHSPMHPVE